MRFCSTKATIRTLVLLTAVLTAPSFAAAEPLKILPLGDSITYGIGSLDNGGYRTKLWQDFGSNASAVDFLGTQQGFAADLGDNDNEGHSGYGIDNIKTDLASNDGVADSNGGYWLTGIYHYQLTPPYVTIIRPAIYPDIILLHIGTNDISRGASAATAATRLDGLISEIFKLRPATTLMLASLVPRTDDAGMEAVTEQYNALIPGLVTKYSDAGKSIYFVDMHSELTAADLYDGLHPNRDGYAKMGDAWFDAIQAIPEPGTLALLITGSVLAAAVAWRRKK
jgi:lysophospholipase L1-like esterase